MFQKMPAKIKIHPESYTPEVTGVDIWYINIQTFL